MKTEVVRVRLTEIEKQMLMDHADSMNMSMSDYIKYCCLMNPPKRIKEELLQDFQEIEKARKGIFHHEDVVDEMFKKSGFESFKETKDKK